MDEIKEGEIVRLTGENKAGIVSAIVDYGTHTTYFIDFGELLKFPAKREWIERIPQECQERK